MAITEAIKNAAALGNNAKDIARNGDSVMQGRGMRYFGMPLNLIADRYAKYATDYYEAEIQGYDPDDFYRYWPMKIRAMDIVRESTGSNITDNIKEMVVCEPAGVDYIPIGAYAKFQGNTWIVTNPVNSSGVLSANIIRRCDLVYNRLDYYGNILSTPFVLNKEFLNGVQDDYTKTMILADEYAQCIMQKNEVSGAIRTNTRIIIGTTAYSVRGVNDYSREFTEKADSVHTIWFYIEREEDVKPYDDLVNGVADGLAFSWEIRITGSKTLYPGMSQTLTAKSVRMGENIESTDENPFHYVWSSSNTAVLTVDANGTVTAVSAGSAEITCSLKENRNIFTTTVITVEEASGAYIGFYSAVPEAITAGESFSVKAGIFENGSDTETKIAYRTSGAADYAYTLTTDEDNGAVIRCWESAKEPLVIEIRGTYGGTEYTKSISVKLEGW